MLAFFFSELLLQTDLFDGLDEWDSPEKDLEMELHELADSTLYPGAYSQQEDEGAHLKSLARRLN
jgi:hypothetical protein